MPEHDADQFVNINEVIDICPNCGKPVPEDSVAFYMQERYCSDECIEDMQLSEGWEELAKTLFRRNLE